MPAGQITATATTMPSRDGRHRRTETSRARIVQALIELVEAGQYVPNAEAVAERAGVGLRTVFRLFKDMDTLYGAMQEIIYREVEPLVNAPLPTAPWPEPLFELCRRRARIFERILELRTAADFQRHRSAQLRKSHADMVVMQRALLVRVLPEVLKSDARAVDALDAILSFEVWRQLRHDQQHPPATAEAVVRRMVDGLLATTPTA